MSIVVDGSLKHCTTEVDESVILGTRWWHYGAEAPNDALLTPVATVTKFGICWEHPEGQRATGELHGPVCTLVAVTTAQSAEADSGPQ